MIRRHAVHRRLSDRRRGHFHLALVRALQERGPSVTAPGAFAAAQRYLDEGLGRFRAADWRAARELAVALHQARAEVAFAQRDLPLAGELSDQAHRHARTPIQKAAAATLMLDLFSMLGRVAELTDFGIAAAARQGLTISPHPGPAGPVPPPPSTASRAPRTPAGAPPQASRPWTARAPRRAPPQSRPRTRAWPGRAAGSRCTPPRRGRPPRPPRCRPRCWPRSRRRAHRCSWTTPPPRHCTEARTPSAPGPGHCCACRCCTRARCADCCTWRTACCRTPSRSLAAISIEIAKARQDQRRLNEQLEERVAERTLQLQTTIHNLDAFAYSISHDLRAPLRAVRGFTRILAEDHAAQLDPEGLRLMRKVIDSAARMSRLIDDLLAFSRVGRQHLTGDRVDMNQRVTAAVEDVFAAEPERQVEMIVGELPEAIGDAAMLRQVWTNLLSNAVKFTADRDRPRIEVSFERENDHVVYRVRDNGVGFDPDRADQLFGVFRRLHGNQYPGTGIGLAIVASVVTRHGSRVRAQAVEGRGAALSFTLASHLEAA